MTVALQGWEHNQLRMEKKQRKADESNAVRRLHKAIFKGSYTGSVRHEVDKQFMNTFGDWRGKLLKAEVSRIEHVKEIQRSRAVAQGLKVDGIDLGSMRSDGQKGFRKFLKGVHKMLAEQESHTILASQLILSSETGMPPVSCERYLKKAEELGILKVEMPQRKGLARKVSSLIEVTNEEIEDAWEEDIDVQLRPDPQRIADNEAKRSKFREFLARGAAAVRSVANKFFTEFRKMFQSVGDSAMGLSREFITAVAECPVCGQPKGVSCTEKDGTDRHKNHFERMHKAQIEYPEIANAWKEKDYG
jgi:hypothetical protein